MQFLQHDKILGFTGKVYKAGHGKSIFVLCFRNLDQIQIPVGYCHCIKYHFSPNFLLWKFCGNARFLLSFGWITRNSTMRKLCVSTKFPHQDIRLNFRIFRVRVCFLNQLKYVKIRNRKFLLSKLLWAVKKKKNSHKSFTNCFSHWGLISIPHLNI